MKIYYVPILIDFGLQRTNDDRLHVGPRRHTNATTKMAIHLGPPTNLHRPTLELIIPVALASQAYVL